MSKPRPPAKIPAIPLRGYAVLLAESKARVRTAQTLTVLAVNRELSGFTGKSAILIVQRQAKEGWGAAVIPRLSKDLRQEFPAVKGFSERNLGQDKSVRLVVCAEGPDKDYLTEVASGCTNILMLPLQKETMYWQMLAESDLLVVSLLPGTGAAFFPSKLLSACVAGRPVLALCDESSELARVDHEARCGTVVSSEIPQLIAASIDNLVARPETLAIMGAAGQKFSHKFQWESLLEESANRIGVYGL